jgi:hypothetical protein
MTNKATKILDDLRRSQNNCTRHDLEVIYKGHGFRIRTGAKHDIAIHTKYKQLRGTLPNHKSFAKGYVTCAIELIDESLRLAKQEGIQNE